MVEDGDTDDSGIGLPEVMYALCIVLMGVLVAVLGSWQALLPGAALSGILLVFVGFYGAVIVARGTNFSERVIYILVPVYHFFFWSKYWDSTKRYVACFSVGVILLMVTFGIGAIRVMHRRQQEQQILAEHRAQQEAAALQMKC